MKRTHSITFVEGLRSPLFVKPFQSFAVISIASRPIWLPYAEIAILSNRLCFILQVELHEFLGSYNFGVGVLSESVLC